MFLSPSQLITLIAIILILTGLMDCIAIYRNRRVSPFPVWLTAVLGLFWVGFGLHWAYSAITDGQMTVTIALYLGAAALFALREVLHLWYWKTTE